MSMKVTSIMMSAVALGALMSHAPANAETKFRIAFFASSAQSGFDQAIYEGVQEKAKELGAEVAIYDGEYDAGKQYSQIEDVLAGGKFDAFIVEPSDTVGISGAVAEVAAKKKPLVSVLFPIGPDLTKVDPQVEGVTATVVHPPVAGAKKQAEAVVEYCKDKDPCNTVVLIGQKIYPFDNLRYETYLEVFKSHPNIKVVATGEGNYNADKSLTVMQDILQANSGINVVLANADQHMVGAEIALESAGYNIADLFLVGGGAATIGVEAVRDGRWDYDLAQYPKTMGAMAVDVAIKALKGEQHPNVVDMDTVGPLPAMLDKSVLDANPGFKGEWAQ